MTSLWRQNNEKMDIFSFLRHFDLGNNPYILKNEQNFIVGSC